MALTILPTNINAGLTDLVIYTATTDLIGSKAPTFIVTGTPKFIMILVEHLGQIQHSAVLTQLQTSVAFNLLAGDKVHAIASAANSSLVIVVPNW